MATLIDTSVLIALLDAENAGHEAATRAWREFRRLDEQFVTTNYVVVETIAVVQRRLGMKALGVLLRELLPLVSEYFVEEETHRHAMEGLLAASRRELSLVDCVSFVVMRDLGIQRVFTLDHHFAEQGFEVLPEPQGPGGSLEG